MSWEIDQVTDEETWTKDYVREVIAHMPTFPPKVQHLGNTRVSWFETEPGTAFIATVGGEVADREFAEILVREQLQACGIKQAQFTFSRVHKVADWDDIEAKATRLIQSGNVTLLRNGGTNIVAHVTGDHGDYQTEISREDPDSDRITQWQCDCPWDQFAWQRTRQWKKYEGRCCSHVLATYWAARSTPLDEEAEPEVGGQGSLFDPGTAQPAPRVAPPPPVPGPQQLSIPGVTPPGQPPPGPEIIPPFPGLPPINPVSIPGGRVPTPMDPIQHPGGTFSKVADWDFSEGEEEEGGWKWVWDMESEEGNYGDQNTYHDDLMTPLSEHPTHWGTITGDGLVDVYNKNEMGASQLLAWLQTINPVARYPADAEEKVRAGDFAMRIAADFNNSDMVRLEVEEYGVMEGKSEAHGAGEYKLIPKGSIGEVLGQDNTTGWVDCAFAGPQAGAGPLEPYHVRCWLEPAKLTPMPKVQKPGPFVKRRR